MGHELHPGPASYRGLEWLTRVGSAPLEAWRFAMGWSFSVATSHMRRLEQAGLIQRHRMSFGDGLLLVATRRGVAKSGLHLTAPPVPAPTWWAHECACAWTAAWLTVRGRDWRGPREVLADPELKGQLEWTTRTGRRRAGHRPDLAVQVPAGTVVIEVELQRKSENRLEAILSLYRRWFGERRLAGLIYVCGTEARAKHVRKLAADSGLPSAGFRIELLDAVQEEARGARA
jgi:hypothetical protein